MMKNIKNVSKSLNNFLKINSLNKKALKSKAQIKKNLRFVNYL